MTAPAIRLMRDIILVELIEPETLSRGGIILLSAMTEGRIGKVVAVGPGKKLPSGEISPVAVSVGQSVMFGDRIGEPYTIDGKKYLGIKEGDILGVIEQ